MLVLSNLSILEKQRRALTARSRPFANKRSGGTRAFIEATADQVQRPEPDTYRWMGYDKLPLFAAFLRRGVRITFHAVGS